MSQIHQQSLGIPQTRNYPELTFSNFKRSFKVLPHEELRV
ncbi:hypothetical protein CKA32_005425 [Geitlerinema sp. FC II]|nr:hypothetical protein CKA32_005425 [Geitlerinema sp. FC II]